MTASPPVPRSRRGEILAAAAGLFARQGYSATTMQAIADEVGVLKGSLYHHFTSKEEILFEVTRDPLVALVDNGAAIRDLEASPPEKLRLLLAMHMRALDASYPHLGVITAERDESLPPGVRDRLVSFRRAYQEIVESICREGLERGEIKSDRPPAILVNFILGAVNWMHRWYRPGGDLSPERLAEILSDTVLCGTLTDAGLIALESEKPSADRGPRRRG